MEFSELALERPILPAKLKQFEKKNIYTVDDLVYRYPKYFLDFSKESDITSCNNGDNVALHIIIDKVTLKESASKKKYVKAECREYNTKYQIDILWFNTYIYNQIEDLHGLEAIVCGNIKIDNKNVTIIEPAFFTTDTDNGFRIYPVYKKVEGMSDDYLKTIIEASLNQYESSESIEEDILNDWGIITEKQLLKNLHEPKCVEDIINANHRLIFEKLYNFANKMIGDAKEIERKSSIKPLNLNKTNQFIQMFPYELTSDQQKVVKEFVEKAQKGKRINALIQGDVGSGKTVCAFLLMLSMADNGYQSVLMAPTGVLAKQHYEEFKSYVEPLGLKVAYLDGNVKTKEKKEILSKIKNGELNFLIGTHSVIGEDVEFNNLGLTVVDEEHKFGVIQRESLKKKASEGVHSISMSATPIPRSLSLTIYGEALDIYTIETVPSGRKPVKTVIVNDDISIFRFMEQEIAKGHQCYIVCPLIEDKASKDPDEIPPESVEVVRDKATKYFEIKGIKVDVITGKMKDDEKSAIIERFKNNESQILIATTIIEVGVNVPNATVIAIMGSERFGLAGLHQLRGRVGRSNLQSYCILKSYEKNNPRLQAMCNTTNGFKIAEIDLALRGTGDFLGTRQSGDDENITLALKYPKYYELIKEYIRERK